jgi:hypothetical protein
MKTSSILICPVHPLRHMPDPLRDAMRTIFTEWVRGMDTRSQRRLLRLVGQIARAEAGEGFQLFRLEERSGPFHRRHRVVLEALFQAQEAYPNIDALHDHLKLKTWFVTWKDGKPTPRSTSFEDCSEDEIREFHARVVDLLHDPYEQRKLFPSVPAKLRQGMVDAVLADKENAHGNV